MASEAITQNDLKAIFDAVLPVGIVEEPFTLTLNVSGTPSAQHCYYNTHTRIVRITASVWSSSTSWGQSQAFWTIPEKYRPLTTITAPAVLMTSTAFQSAPYVVTIGTDGTVKQNLTSACRCMFFSAEYTI